MLVSNYPNVSINTANPPTEMARRDASRRDLFEPVRETNASGAEKPVVTDEKSRQASNSNGSVQLYDANGKETETRQAIEGRGEQASDQQTGEQGQQRNGEQDQGTKQRQAEQAEQQEIRELSARDLEVKAHEQAHAAIGGRYASAPSYSYERGPDGKQYAVGGEVQIDIAPIPGDPQATIQKMQQVRAAALAPAEPSAADRRIAGEALKRQLQAQSDLIQQNQAPAKNDAPAKPGLAGQLAETEISYSVADSGNTQAGTIVYPQQDTLAIAMQMQVRRNVISGFYQKATEPQLKQSLQQI